MENNSKNEVQMSGNAKFNFAPEKGWFQRTASGNEVYANKTYGHGKVLGGANAFARVNAKPLRPNGKFPHNPQGVSDTILYHCHRHDYVFYPSNFTDADGNMRQRGFYDENADFHPDIKMLYYPQSDGVVCRHCGHNTVFDVNLQNISDLWCSQCGAEIDYMKVMNAEWDFLVYADCFDKGKQLVIQNAPQTPYVQPQENPSYHREWKKPKSSDKSYSDYIQENFGSGESGEGSLSKLENIDMPLSYIKTREYKPAPVKPWKPSENNKLAATSARSSQEDSFKGFQFEDSPKNDNVKKTNKYGEEIPQGESTYMKSGTVEFWDDVLDSAEPFWSSGGRPSMTDLEDVYGENTNQRREERLKPLSFDEPLTAIKTREYKPAPVVQQTYHPERYKVITGTRKGIYEESAKAHTEAVLSILEDIKDVFSTPEYTASDVANMKDLSDKTKGEYPAEEVWSVSNDADYSMFRREKNDDADYSMFRREKISDDDPMKNIKEYWSRNR